MLQPLAAPAFRSVGFVLLAICQSLCQTRKVIPHSGIAAVLLLLPASAAHAQEQAAQKEPQGFSASSPSAQTPPASQTATAAAPAGSSSVTALTDNGWPRDIMSGTTRITIFQPQIDTWDGFRITGRSAVAVTEKPDAPPLYGIIHISADAHIDKDEGMVSLEKIIVKTAAFPAVDPEKGRRWATDVQARATTMRPMALERFQAALEVSAAERRADQVAVKNDPPVVHISRVPSMLILIDGEPVYRPSRAPRSRECSIRAP